MAQRARNGKPCPVRKRSIEADSSEPRRGFGMRHPTTNAGAPGRPLRPPPSSPALSKRRRLRVYVAVRGPVAVRTRADAGDDHKSHSWRKTAVHLGQGNLEARMAQSVQFRHALDEQGSTKTMHSDEFRTSRDESMKLLDG